MDIGGITNMDDSMYLELCYVNNEAKFYEFVIANNLDKNIADVLYGNAEGKWIHRSGFAETKNGGILIEIGRDLLDWQEALKKYIKDHPAIIKAKMFTKLNAKKELKTLTMEIV